MFIASLIAVNAEAAIASWDKNPEPNVLGYVLSYGTQPGQHTIAIDVGNVLSYEFFPPSGGRYYVVVQAYNSSGLGPKSAEVIYDTSSATTNRAPTLATPADQINNAGDWVSVQLSASDPDGTPLSFSATNLPPGLTLGSSSGFINGVLSTNAAGQYHVTVTASDGQLTASRSFTWSVNGVTTSPISTSATDVPISGDFDGDGRADLATWRPSNGEWRLRASGQGYATASTIQWGLSSDVPMAADYDGDRRTDIAVYRPANGVWYVLLSTTNYQSRMDIQWGDPLDRPAPVDYDNDGRADLVLPRAGAFMILLSGSNYASSTTVSAPQLLASDVAIGGDFDGDGRADLTTYRPSTGEWRRWLSGSNFAMASPIQWGLSTDVPVPADYDGDRRLDITAYRPSSGVWYVLLSSANYQARMDLKWGGSEDRPLPVDYDSDGRADLAVLRSSGFAIAYSSTHYGSSVTVP